MKDTEKPRVFASYKLGFRKTLKLTDKGIRTEKLNIPYGSIKECNCYRDLQGVPDRCALKYIGESGLDEHVEFGGRGLKIYSDILRISRQYGYKIPQRPHGKLSQWARGLKGLNIESEFVEPEPGYHTQSDSFWMRDLGGLELRGTGIDTVKVVERGEITVNSPFTGERRVDIEHYFTYVIQIEPIPSIYCHGTPIKKFPRRVVDYHWQGSKLAESLDKDAELRKRLTKAKAPPIEVEGNHILMQDKRFPSSKLFRCIDMIAGHVKEACQ